ncbi:hybrid sensor histidine kinase/response regulator transcription factor [Winogradskyella vidalii]|uniref:hybrid sensor histidine kinase/response regulator transcription factor n=1 Tax=Winogradskyella vidalii TaxID=2615024 RepID=UPI0015CEE757|nr:hybrid sensor histidine kinase/response regulator transcription factor [Winogradskyella vidalii]
MKPLLILLFSFFYFGVSAQETALEDAYFDKLTIEDGLSQSTVLSIYQDYYGFMWFGTRNGLNLYNGNKVEIFKHKVGDSTSISGNIINSIVEDYRKRIWMATESGISVYHRDTKHFENYYIQDEFLRNGDSKINKLFFDSQQQLWVAGAFGFLGFDEDTKMFFEPKAVKAHRETNGNIYVNDIQEDKNDNLWIATGSNGFLKLNLKSNRVESINLLNDVKNQPRIETIQFADSGNVWVGTYGDGVFLITSTGDVVKRYHTASTGNKTISNDFVRCMVKDSQNRLWIGTFNGLTIIHPNGNSEFISYSETNLKGLNHNSIRSLFRDRKGSIWIGTYFGGLNIYDEHNQQFNHFYHSEGNSNSISYNVIGAFTEGKQDELYIGTERGGLNTYNPSTKKFSQIRDDFDNKSTIKALCTTPDGKIWAGLFNRGLYVYNPQQPNLELQKVIGKDHFPENPIINYLYHHQGKLWIATDANGVYCFNLKTKQFEDYKHQNTLNKAIGYSPVKQIFYLKNKMVLVTKGKGLIFFDSESGVTKTIVNYNIDGKIVKLNELNSAYLKGANLWLASNGEGVLVYNLNTEKTIQIEASKGLSSNTIYGFLEDKHYSIWTVSLNGISLLNTSEMTVEKNYTYKSGMPLYEVNEGAFYKTNNESFLIGGNNGFTKFNPEQLQDNNYNPQPVLTELKVMNTIVTPGDNSGVLKTSIQESEHITLSYFQSVLSISFAMLNYLHPENNEYAYQLEGFDEDWIESQQQQMVTYTNLKSGDYKFMVKAANNDGVWSQKPRILSITVLPPPWQTWWAYVIYTLLIIGGFYLIRYNAIKSTQLKHDLKVEQLEKAKWKEIHELKLKYYTDVSHEFRTPLSLILAPMEELLNFKQENTYASALLKRIFYNAKRLKLLIDQVLEIRELETGHTALNLSPIYLDTYIEDIFYSFETLAKNKKIKVDFKVKKPLEIPVMVDKDKIEKIFFNLFSNAIKFTAKHGLVKVIIRSNKIAAVINYNFEIIDTGVGIPDDMKAKIFDRFQKGKSEESGTGIGLSLAKSLTELMSGTIKISDNPNGGTIFNVKLPLQVVNDINISSVKPTLEYTPLVPVLPEKGSTLKKQKAKQDDDLSKLLIVEDNKELRTYLRDRLKNSYNVKTASNGKNGFEKAKKFGPNLIISDIMMPEVSGIELCKAIKASKELSHIPVILLTAKNTEINKLEGLEFGADDYITKPFSWVELQFRIKNILKNRTLLQQRWKDLSSSPIKDYGSINSYDEKLMKEIFQVIEEKIENHEFTVEILAEKIGMSRVHLYRKIKSLTGETPNKLIRTARLDKAKILLKTGKYKPAEVADRVGFQDVKYFSKSFKKFTGQNPSEFHKQ